MIYSYMSVTQGALVSGAYAVLIGLHITNYPFTLSQSYIILFLGQMLGILCGLHLSYGKKTLPDGRHIFRYMAYERNHGTRILLIAACSLLFWFIVRLFVFKK